MLVAHTLRSNSVASMCLLVQPLACTSENNERNESTNNKNRLKQQMSHALDIARIPEYIERLCMNRSGFSSLLVVAAITS